LHIKSITEIHEIFFKNRPLRPHLWSANNANNNDQKKKNNKKKKNNNKNKQPKEGAGVEQDNATDDNNKIQTETAVNNLTNSA
jgi:hypothetical protein